VYGVPADRSGVARDGRSTNTATIAKPATRPSIQNGGTSRHRQVVVYRQLALIGVARLPRDPDALAHRHERIRE
jgi:hypothetical protein